MKHKILVADDDFNICNILKSQFESDGYEVSCYPDGKSLLQDFQVNGCDLIITDIMMPDMNGYDLCKEVRKTSNIPIIMVSAKDEEIDRILGLELGSDDYISKPFSLREVSIKVRNMLRRYQETPVDFTVYLSCKDLKINLEERTAILCDREFPLTAKEYDLLEFLLKNKNRAFSREAIIKRVWGYDYIGDNRQVDHIIKRLRKKLLPFECEFNIETLWGFGYKVSD